MTYASLQENIRNYLERGYTAASDPSVYATIPFFIGLAQRRLARELKVLGTVNVVASTMVNGTAVIDKPSRWRQTVSIHVAYNVDEETGFNNIAEIYPRAYEYVRAYNPNPTVTGQPRFYADFDYNHWIVAPTPDDDYPFEVLYNELPALLDDSTQTNWYTEYAPDALLYASLLEAQPFLKNPDMQATWQAMLDRAMAALNGQDQTGQTDRGIVRSAN